MKQICKKKLYFPWIFYLSLSNLILSGFGLPLLALKYYARNWPFPLNTCKYYTFAIYFNSTLSVFFTTLIGLNRALAMYWSIGKNTFYEV